MKYIFFDLLKLERPLEFTDDVLPRCLDTNSYIDYGQTKSKFLKELKYKDISNQVKLCSKERDNERKRYCQTNENHFVPFKLIFPFS